MAKEEFYIDIKVKPYVKQYLINCWGDPVAIHKSDRYFNLLKIYLKRPRKNYKPVIHSPGTCLVRVRISEDIFYRNGFVMTLNQMSWFSKYIEQDLKFHMRMFVDTRALIGCTVADSIRQFQDSYNLTEEVWSFESIKKDIDRHTNIKRENIVNDFFKKFGDQLVENLNNLHNDKDSDKEEESFV